MTNTNQDVCGHDFMRRQQIEDSCRAIKSHASFIGVSAAEILTMPAEFTPGCMDEINEAAGVLQRALDRIKEAKQTLLSKQLEAAE
jgi:hypothetical protein